MSARVQGTVDDGRAYFRAWSRSGLVRRLQQADQVQVTACNGLGLLSYGEPMYATVRPLAGEEASQAARKVGRAHPGRRDLLARLPGRTRLHYELLVP